MSAHEACGCAEYQRLSRRQFMISTGGVAAAASMPAWLPRVVLADDDCSTRDVIVSIFLRGAADGLTLCVPFLEAPYYATRTTIAIPPPDSPDPNHAIDLDGQFAIPQPLAPLLNAYNNNDLLIVHATGSTDPSRSHFDAQRFMEVGKPADPQLFTGWLGRHLFSVAPMSPTALLRAVGIGYGLQRTLQGGPLSLPIPNLDTFDLTGSSSTLAARRLAISDMYALVDDPLRASAQTTQATIDLLNTINFAGYAPGGGAVYPSGSFGYAMKTTAALIKADVGVEAVHIDLGGWDTHDNQGVFTGGTMFNLMTTLANTLAAFHADLWSGNGRNVVVVVLSEFGRRLAQNGTGTDHGHGNVMFVLGNHIAGGRVLTQWPGLGPGQLFQNLDLQVTIDFRDILAEIVQQRLGNNDLSYVFPNFTPTMRGVTQSCLKGDMDCDGAIGSADVAPFAQALADPAAYQQQYPNCDINNADVNLDGMVDGKDVQAFTDLVLP